MATELGNKTVSGDLPFNAEVDIDWQTRDVKFRYPQAGLDNLTEAELQHKRDMAYFAHAFVPILAGIAAVINWGLVLRVTDSMLSIDGIAFTAVYYHLYEFYPALTLFAALTTYGVLALNFMAFLTLFGWVSVALHRSSKRLRDEFPSTNALLKRLFMKKATIDLSQPFGKGWYRLGDTIIMPKVSSVLVELDIPESLDWQIRRVYTVCTEHKPSILAGGFWLFIRLMSPDVASGKIQVRY